MDSCEALSLTCAIHRDCEILCLRRKLLAAHSRNYRLRKKAQHLERELNIERCARHILHEVLLSSLRRTDSLEAELHTGDVSLPPGDPPHEPADTLHQSE